MTKESIYDAQINPLMAQIITICKEHKIAMLASYSLDEDWLCTTVLLTEDTEPPQEFLDAQAIIYRKPPSMTQITVTSADGAKEIHMIVGD